MRRVARTPPLKAIAGPDGTFDDESPEYRALVAARAPKRTTTTATKPNPGPARASRKRAPSTTQSAARRVLRPYPGSVALTVGRTRRGVLVGEPPAATAEQVSSYLKALLTAPRVPADVTAEREATCAACPHARWSLRSDAPWCSICGCKVGGATKYLLKKLTEVAENLPKWGCHHPNRAKGEGWTR